MKTSAWGDGGGYEALLGRFDALDVDPSCGVLSASLAAQALWHVTADGARRYVVSGSRYGSGCSAGSLRTPTGLHRIEARIGAHAPPGAVFVGRELSTRVAVGEQDFITSRILWLKGLEPGVNSGEGCDSYARYIYIHGTPHVEALGTPASRGCIRMADADVIELFESVVEGTPVLIEP